MCPTFLNPRSLYSNYDLSFLPPMNVFALSESVKQTKLENGPNHFSILRKPRFICPLDKALSFAEEKCCLKAKKHKIILWKKNPLFWNKTYTYLNFHHKRACWHSWPRVLQILKWKCTIKEILQKKNFWENLIFSIVQGDPKRLWIVNFFWRTQNFPKV